MKMMSLAAVLLVVSLLAAAIVGLSMMAVRAAAVSTETSIELLRLHLRVERLHEKLLRHSQEDLAGELKALQDASSALDAAEGK
jgi:hypothetical protein